MPMTNKERADKLIAARELITAVAFSLDVTTTPCAKCDLHKFNNYEDRKIHEQLASMESKLTKLAGQYQRKAEEEASVLHA